MSLLDSEMSAKLGTLQSLDDAIAYRMRRLDRPCAQCTSTQKCAEHRHDHELVVGYQDRYTAAFTDVLADMEPDDIALVMQPGDGTPPTVGALSVALMTRLRELAADGPVVLEFDGRAVQIEREGPVLVEYPLAPGSTL